MSIYCNSALFIVFEDDEYTDSNGVFYSKWYRKSEIAELHLIVETNQVLYADKVITGWTVEADATDPNNIIYRQVWQSRYKTADELLADLNNAKSKKIKYLSDLRWYFTTLDISLTTVAGSAKVYQANQNSIFNIQSMLDTYPVEMPQDFYWVTKDDYRETPFTRTDLQHLASAIGDRGYGYFKNYQDKKVLVLGKTTIEDVESVGW